MVRVVNLNQQRVGAGKGKSHIDWDEVDGEN